MDYSPPALNLDFHLHTPAAMSATIATQASSEPKTVRFQLITPDSPHTTARLPMRVQIYPHDSTDSIVTTVKNFYGLYSSPTSSKGVSFEDDAGNTMIARYENFRDNMVVYVRVIEEPALSPNAFASHSYCSPPAGALVQPFSEDHYGTDSPYHHTYASFQPHNENHSYTQQQHSHDEFIVRPGSRTSRKRSMSPSSARGRRSVSASNNTNSKNRSRSSKNRSGTASDLYATESLNGYSSGDGAPGSTTGRVKEQQPIGNTEISVENIVEGGRRKRAKFESSELPLFAPPQMPAATSNSSVSPARRSDHRPSLPFVFPGQNPFSATGSLHSPQSYNTTHFSQGSIYTTPTSDGRCTRTSMGYIGVGSGMGVLPTPDPTVSSVSEEDKDVAMQLMRLGEISNFSYGRTSTSTQDDTFSGRADAASSTGATSDSESDSDCESTTGCGAEYHAEEDEVAPPKRKQKLDTDDSSHKIYQSVENAYDNTPCASTPTIIDTASISTSAAFTTSADISGKIGATESVAGLMAAPKLKKTAKSATGANGFTAKAPRAQTTKPKAKTSKGRAGSSATMGTKTKKQTTMNPAIPISPTSLSASRKLSVASNGSVPIAAASAMRIGNGISTGSSAGCPKEEDVADLSSKPRCQRCRKSKKGCDRQRPCGRCRDAGIPAELCISEDEGNGRKGRYGRHMGVPIKKETTAASAAASGSSMRPPPPPPQQMAAATTVSTTTSISAPSQLPELATPHHIPSPYQLSPLASVGSQPSQLEQQPQALQKQMLAFLSPTPISSTPILAPTIPSMAMASTDKNKKRKR